MAGYANIAVPAGSVGPLPIGVSIIGGRWDKPTLIGFASSRRPRFASRQDSSR
jgi:amidase